MCIKSSSSISGTKKRVRFNIPEEKSYSELTDKKTDRTAKEKLSNIEGESNGENPLGKMSSHASLAVASRKRKAKQNKINKISDNSFFVMGNVTGIAALVGAVALGIFTQNFGLAIGFGAGGLGALISTNGLKIYNSYKKRKEDAEKQPIINE